VTANRSKTTINEAHAGEEIDLGEILLTDRTGDNKQTQNEPQTVGNEENTNEDSVFNSTLPWGRTPSGAMYYHCCNKVVSMKR
jgi:hypothetical protein